MSLRRREYEPQRSAYGVLCHVQTHIQIEQNTRTQPCVGVTRDWLEHTPCVWVSHAQCSFCTRDGDSAKKRIGLRARCQKCFRFHDIPVAHGLVQLPLRGRRLAAQRERQRRIGRAAAEGSDLCISHRRHVLAVHGVEEVARLHCLAALGRTTGHQPCNLHKVSSRR